MNELKLKELNSLAKEIAILKNALARANKFCNTTGIGESDYGLYISEHSDGSGKNIPLIGSERFNSHFKGIIYEELKTFLEKLEDEFRDL